MIAPFFLYLIAITFESPSTKRVNPKSSNDYINKNFTGNFEPEQVITGNSLVEQISGCYFTNIRSPNKNYYFRINNQVEIFDNVFENTVQDDNQPAPFWVDGNRVQINIKRCRFIRIASLRDSSNGNILNSDSTTKILFEDCQFDNCGLQSSKALIVFKNTGPGAAQFTRCSFYFEDSSDSCQIINIQSSDVIFEDCIFTRCEADTIILNIGTGSTKTGQFQFINNVVKEMNYRFINAVNVRDIITIRNNTFEKCTLTDSFFIYIEHNQPSVELSYNTFSDFKVIGEGDITNGGIATFLKSSQTTTSTYYKLTYDHCNFYDITNSHTKLPYFNGGAIQFGYGTDLLNIDVFITNCQFKRNTSPANGGAVAFKTCGQITIQNCIFEENKANNQISSGKHLSEETEGRGGAIYISSPQSENDKLKGVKIENCLFKKNSAYDGFSIYFDGTESETAPTLTNNEFVNNYNCQGSPNNGGCITSEILNIVKDDVLTNNVFSNNELGSESEHFIFVDQSGVKLPDPTPTPIPMPPTKTPIPESFDAYIDKNFSGTFSEGQVNTFDKNIKQISGCRFIDIESKNKNYYIKITNQCEIFNNVFENTKIIDSSPAIFWVYLDQKQITIKNCQFIRITELKDQADGCILNSDSTTKIVFEDCQFMNCGIDSDKPLVDFKPLQPSECGSIQFTRCTFYWDDVTKSCQITRIFNSKVIIDQCELTRCEANAIHVDIASGGTTETGDFVFTNNVVRNMNYRFIDGTNINGKITITGNKFEKCTLNDDYFIHLDHNQMSVNLSCNSFTDFKVTGTNGISTGGIATFIKSTADRSSSNYKLIYDHCNFTDITNTFTSSSYYNGGAIQFGFSAEKNNVDITLLSCRFKQNRATKHGGAVAFQTLGSIVIQDCIFEDNKANNVQSSKSLSLLDEKNEGRGGAIFISAGDSSNHVASVLINKCTFKRNIAFDGFAIYFEGEESDATFTITENNFVDNYNINSDLSNRASVSSELIVSITQQYIEDSNNFSNIYEGLDSRKFIHVNHQGIPLPDPTPLPTPTPTPNPDYINHNFTGNFKPGQVITGNSLVEQISGCYFTNIRSPNRDYYFRINNQVEIFDNVFENTIQDDNQPAPFWVDGNRVQINIKRCRFIRIASLRDSSNGNILNSDSTTKILFEDCQFDNCGLQSSKALIVFKNAGPGAAQFTRCSFYFEDSSDSCQIINIQSSDVIFEDCIFTRCEADTIILNIGTGSTKTGQFQFINNVVKEMNYRFIIGTNVRDTISFVNNTFDQVTLTDSYLIEIQHNQESINLINNSFLNFKISGSTQICCGGTAILLKESESSTKLRLTYENCKFENVENSLSGSPNNNGGALQFGFSTECVNVDVTLKNCLFKGNKSPKHGGAVAIQTYGIVLIKNCTFEENKANYKTTKSSLLAEKLEGRGGAIFISCGNSAKHIESVTIEECTFNKNTAFDGFAVYIEGEEQTEATTTTFTITSNKFNNNYDGNNDSPENSRSCFTSEILSIEKVTIVKENKFSNIEFGSGTRKFSHVDQSGNPYPDSTAAPSPTLPSEPNIDTWDEHTNENKVRCEKKLDPDVEEERNIVVDVKTTLFENMEYSYGGAIHLENCGLKCNSKCQFINCISNDGPGGAIYINNPNEILNGVTLDDLTFKSNKGQYGGAIYIYSSSILNEIKITKCTFTGNLVDEKPTTEGFIGGSAMYLNIMRGTIVRCKFTQNNGPGGSIKLINEFSSSSNSQSLLNLIEDDIKYVTIDECSFEIGNKEKSSIFYESGNFGSSFEVKNCIFSGKLAKGCHHIDGKLIVKNAPKLVVKNCKFDSDKKEALDANADFVFADMKKQVFRKEKNDKKLIFISTYVLPVTALIALVLIVFLMKKIKKTSPQDEHEMNTFADAEITKNLI